MNDRREREFLSQKSTNKGATDGIAEDRRNSQRQYTDGRYTDGRYTDRRYADRQHTDRHYADRQYTDRGQSYSRNFPMNRQDDKDVRRLMRNNNSANNRCWFWFSVVGVVGYGDGEAIRDDDGVIQWWKMMILMRMIL